MVFQINQLDTGPLQAIANQRAASLNLPVANYDPGYQGALENAKLGEQYADLGNQLQIAQGHNAALIQAQKLQNQGNINVANLQANKAAALQQNQQQFQGGQNTLDRQLQAQAQAATAAYQRGELSNQQYQNYLTRLQNQTLATHYSNQDVVAAAQQQSTQNYQNAEVAMDKVKTMLSLKDENFKLMGGLSNGLMYSLMYAKTPEEKVQALNNAKQFGIQSGIFEDSDQANQLLGNDPNTAMGVAANYAMLGNFAQGNKGENIGPLGGMFPIQQQDGSYSYVVPLNADQKKAMSDKMQNLQLQSSQLSDLQQSYNPAWDQGVGKFKTSLLGPTESAVGYEGGAAQEEADKEAWMAKATALNASSLVSDLPGARPSGRNANFLSGLIIHDGDNATVKQAKMKGLQQVNSLLGTYYNKTYTSGLPLDAVDNNKLNQDLSKLDPSQQKQAQAASSTDNQMFTTRPNSQGQVQQLSMKQIKAMAQAKNMDVNQAMQYIGATPVNEQQ